VDVDVLIARDDHEVLERTLAAGGFSQKEEGPNFARYASDAASKPGIDVLYVDGATFATLWGSGVPLIRAEHEFRAPDLPHLIALKLHAVRNNPRRAFRDLRDISELPRVNPGAITDEDLKELCDRFGPANVFPRLRE
jgi:hypothetical protein